jgi:hypothetical protein
MKCVLCLYVRKGQAPEAITVCEGYAVCEDHLGLVAHGLDWHGVLKAAMRQEAGEEDGSEAPRRDEYGDVDLGVPEDPGAWR